MTRRLLILYGSETGNGLGIAEELYSQLTNDRFFVGHSVDKLTLNEVTEGKGANLQLKLDILNSSCLVVILSSTGDGDPPANADRFVRKIVRSSATLLLQETPFCLLGLGSSDYSTIYGCPKRVHKALLKHGCTEFFPSGWADEATPDWSTSVEEWKENIVPALKQLLGGEPIDELCAFTAVCISSPVATVEQNKTSPEPLMEFRCFLNLDQPVPNEPNDDNDDSTSLLPQCNCKWPDEGISLVRGTAEWEMATELKIPVLPIENLSASVSHERPDCSKVVWQNGQLFAGCVGPITTVKVASAAKLSDTAASKPKHEIVLDIQGTRLCYEPGDAFYFIFSNPYWEVDYILQRLSLVEIADQKVTLSVKTEGKLNIPSYFPSQDVSLRYIFTYCLDIRRVNRQLLRILSEGCSVLSEKQRLQQLCSTSKLGTHEFNCCIRQPGLSLADILHAFPSCRPSAEYLIEYLPQLKPRPYSAASSTLASHSQVRFVYSVLNFPQENGRFYKRTGLCTHYLLQQQPENTLLYGDMDLFSQRERLKIADDGFGYVFDRLSVDGSLRFFRCDRKNKKEEGLVLLETTETTAQIINTAAAHLTVAAEGKMPNIKAQRKIVQRARNEVTAAPPNPATLQELVQVLLKEPSGFRLPQEDALISSLILIGIGTGVAPFLGFLQHLSALRADVKAVDVCDDALERWLVFGCRNIDTDWIYSDEMVGYAKDGLLTKLLVCESRPTVDQNNRDHVFQHYHGYVQEGLRANGASLVQLLLQGEHGCRRPIVYICGDAKGMSKDIFACFVTLFEQHAGKTKLDAVKFLQQLKENGQYIEDVWA